VDCDTNERPSISTHLLKAFVISLVSGAIAGMAHVLSGPDHLAAVAPLAMEQRERCWNTGLRWGLGHSSGVILVGVLSLLLREVLPVDWLSAWSERFVGLVLIGVGLWGVLRALSRRVHTHEHVHDGHRHMHVHAHSDETAHPPGTGEGRAHSHGHAAFAVGALHGLAGSSHFLGVLPALAFPTAGQAVVYLGAYGAGTVVAMMGFSSAMGWVARAFAVRGVQAYRAVMLAVSLAAVGVGSYWLAV